ncbi:MAG: hypothetical protein ACP5E5_11710 [Acidobacteriaceae bacterium]
MQSMGLKPVRERQSSQSGLPLDEGSWRQMVYRAAPFRLPELTSTLQRELEAYAIYCREREQLERRSVLRGLILLALLVLSVSVLRAGLDRVFFQGWWRFQGLL